MPTIIEWVERLSAQIDEQKRYAAPWEQRYCNEYVVPFIEREYREVYGAKVDMLVSQLAAPRTGTAAIGVDALVERLTVDGAASRDDGSTAEAAVRIVEQAWEDNDLDVMHREAHREALIKARSFAIVARSQMNGRAVVSIETCEQVAVHRQQAPPYDVDAALKVWVDEWTGKTRGCLWLPGIVVDLEQGTSTYQDPDPAGTGKTSTWRPTAITASDLPGTPRVPVIPFEARPRLLKPPVSEIEGIATLVDIVDLIEGLMVFAGHFGAVPIRYGTGLEIPRDPAHPDRPLLGPDGKPMVGFNPRADHLWVSTSKDAKFGQLEPAGLASFVAWAEHATSRVRARTAVASTYYSLDLKSHMSAELLKTDEAPMVRRIWGMGRDGSFNQSWRRVQNEMLIIESPGMQARLRPRWADPETRVESQSVDSFTKAVAAGVGVEIAAQEFLGWSPELARRAVEEMEGARDRLAGGLSPMEQIELELSTGAPALDS